MSASIFILHSGDGERARVLELAAAIVELGSTVAVSDLDSGDYDRILDEVALADTVINWTAVSGA